VSVPKTTLIVLAVLLAAALSIAAFLLGRAGETEPRSSLLFSATAFSGKIDRNPASSVEDWPKMVSAPVDAPSVIIVLLDDAGFAASEAFGGLTHTPALSQLAANGISYNRFNTTAVCSPTRAALLTGRNSHQVGFGGTPELSSGFPGYNAIWSQSTASIAEVLRTNGFSTAMFGKWHNTPRWEISPVGPFDRWPTGLGFEQFYGFMTGETSQWEPLLWRNTTPVDPPKTAEQGYQFASDIADNAIDWLHTQETLAPDKPYFLYLAAAGPHKPHHVAADRIEKYKGIFDAGWDILRQQAYETQKARGLIPSDTILTPRPSAIPAWDTLSVGEKKLAAHEMETYAAFLEYTDYEIGRVLDVARNGPRGDNTLVIYIASDNGASGMDGIWGNDDTHTSLESVEKQLARVHEAAGPGHLNAYSAGWAWMNNTPFKYMKLNASHFGGTRAPMVVSWPSRIKDVGSLRSQFTHVTDIAATIYDAVGVAFPEQMNGVRQTPLEGRSFVNSFDDPAFDTGHDVQYFENWGDVAIYEKGWVAAKRRISPWQSALNNVPDEDADKWELYNIEEDFSQANDLASKMPEKLASLETLFDREAWRNNVYPSGLDWDQVTSAPTLLGDRTRFVFYPGGPPLVWQAIPNTVRSHKFVAHLSVPKGGVEGVILSSGSRLGGYALYVKHGVLTYENNYSGRKRQKIESSVALPEGAVKITFEFDGAPKETGGVRRFGRSQFSGVGRLFVNDEKVAEGALDPVATNYYGTATFNIGLARNSPVSDAYALPFAFTGGIEKVELELN
jgi:arylsulfatase